MAGTGGTANPKPRKPSVWSRIVSTPSEKAFPAGKMEKSAEEKTESANVIGRRKERGKETGEECGRRRWRENRGAAGAANEMNETSGAKLGDDWDIWYRTAGKTHFPRIEVVKGVS